jgi:hypothetical protein
LLVDGEMWTTMAAQTSAAIPVKVVIELWTMGKLRMSRITPRQLPPPGKAKEFQREE